MARITIVTGIILVVLGLGAYVYAMSTGSASVTALIPAFVGVPILLLGLGAARWPARRALLAHIAVALALIGMIGAGRGLLSLPKLFTDPDAVARPAAVIVQSIMVVVCLVYVILAVHSFIAARRAAGPAAP